jgi:hypothetical protein
LVVVALVVDLAQESMVDLVAVVMVVLLQATELLIQVQAVAVTTA